MAIATTQDTTPQKREATLLERAILVDWYQETLRRFLGTPEAVDALIAEIFTQARKSPNLYRCTMDSARFTIARIASLKLNPGLPNEVFLVPRENKQPDGSYAMEMSPQYGYAGLRKLALRSPEVADCFTKEVCANDVYEPPATLVSLPTHRLPGRFLPRGRVEGYYAAVQLTNGNWRTWPMSVAEVEAHAKRYVKDLSRAPAWQKGTRPDVEDGLTPFDKMGLKTCLRMLLNGRDIPLSSEVQDALQHEEVLQETAAQAQGYERDGSRPAALTTGSGLPMDVLNQELYGDKEAVYASLRYEQRQESNDKTLTVDRETGEIQEGQDTPKNARDGGKGIKITHSGAVDTQELNLTAPDTKKEVSQVTGWRRIIEQHLLDSDTLQGKIPVPFQTECLEAFHSKMTHDAQGEKLAAQLVEWVASQQG